MNATRIENWKRLALERGLTVTAVWWYTIGQRNVRGIFVRGSDGREYACDQERHLDAAAKIDPASATGAGVVEG